MSGDVRKFFEEGSKHAMNVKSRRKRIFGACILLMMAVLAAGMMAFAAAGGGEEQ